MRLFYSQAIEEFIGYMEAIKTYEDPRAVCSELMCSIVGKFSESHNLAGYLAEALMKCYLTRAEQDLPFVSFFDCSRIFNFCLTLNRLSFSTKMCG